MNKRPGNLIEGENNAPKLRTLDIIKIGGRWAQVFSGETVGKQWITFLDDGSSEDVDLADYNFIRHIDLSVGILIESQGDRFRPEEIERIHYGVESRTNPGLKLLVKVFGEYQKK